MEVFMREPRKLLLVLVSCAFLCLPGLSLWCVASYAQEAKTVSEPKPPILAEVPKLTIQNRLKDMEIAELYRQRAETSYEKARQDLLLVLQSVKVPGYDLDLKTLTYKATASPAATPPETPKPPITPPRPPKPPEAKR
jgi:hypothetical protein